MINTRPPCELGESLSGYDSARSVYINDQWLGMKFLMQAPQTTWPGARDAKDRLSGAGIVAVLLRNVSGFALLPKRVVKLGTGWDSTHGCWGFESATGNAVTLADRAVIVDPWLPSAGVADNDIFWGVLEGPCLVMTPKSDMALDIVAGYPIVAATLNTTSGNTTAGKIQAITLPGQTGDTSAYSAAANLLGWAVTAKVTSDTDDDVLIKAAIRY